ncbi:MAG TPA: TadE/TadG family type IV pilus assembly protein, partial [Gemmataceae bacterium]|nr:TadE/TadG family type IV pilus assembly protein [Gemmataceae bacterium]
MTGDRNRFGPNQRRGAAAVEFAVVLPFLIIILAGVWEVGRLVQVSQIVQNAAREAARQASTGTVPLATIKTNVQNYIRAAEPRITNFTGFDVAFTDLTNSAVTDPTNCSQLDKFTITVTLPFDNLRWSLTKMFTPTGSRSQATVTWYSLTDLLVDWYMPLACELREEYLALWRAVLPLAEVSPPTLVLRDYHVDNLMLLPGRPG